MMNKREQKGIGATKFVSRTITGTLALPFRLLALVGSFILIIGILLLGLFLFKFINDNYTAFQDKLKNDPTFEPVLLNIINTTIVFFNIAQKLLAIAIEIIDYTVPTLNLAVYIFYRLAVAFFLTLFGGGVTAPPNDAGDSSLPLMTPDPEGALTGDTQTFFTMLECILIDLLTLLTGAFKVWIRAVGACLLVVFQWLDENLLSIWYRQEYCRLGTDAGWPDPSVDPDSGRDIYPNGSGPGNTCPDNSMIIRSLIRLYEMIINIVRDVFILVFPLVADLLKMLFDAFLKILPQLMEGIVKIIEIFSPDQPLGKMLMFVINFMIQVLGFFLKSCVIQLITSIVMCYFNVVITLIVNTIRSAIKVLVEVVCLGGKVCSTDVAGDHLSFPNCDWSSFTDCIEENYDGETRNVTAICQIPTCTVSIRSIYHKFHQGLVGSAHKFPNNHEYRIEYHKACVSTHTSHHNHSDDTVRGHLFCRYLNEEVHKPPPLGIDPSVKKDVFTDGEEFCGQVQESCLCKYNSPICESQTCCLTFYSVLVQQILSDMDLTYCDDWNKKATFAQVYCISRTQRSLELSTRDLLGTATHCDGFVGLVNMSCHNQPPKTEIDIKGVVGGMCKWVDAAGFCDAYRRPKVHPTGMKEIVNLYNQHIEEMNKMQYMQYTKPKEPVTKRRKNAFTEMSHHYYKERVANTMAMISDHYEVTLYVMLEAFPRIGQMLIHSSYNRALGAGTAPVKLHRDFVTPDGRLRLVRRDHKDEWMDITAEQEINSLKLDGTEYSWVVGAVPPTPYDPGANCGSQSTEGYNDDTTFNCAKGRVEQTGDNTAGTIGVITSPGQAQDKIDDMVANSSSQIFSRTTNRTTFQVPAKSYVQIMWETDIKPPSTVQKSDANRTNEDPNWREPLDRKPGNTTNNRPGGFSIYSHSGPQQAIPLSECPVPVEFYWKEIGKKRKTFLTPIQAMLKEIPEALSNNIPDTPSLNIPKHIRDSLYLMHTRKTNSLSSDIKTFSRAWTDALRGAYKISVAVGDLSRGIQSPKEENETKKEESWWSMNLEGLPNGTNPSFLHNLFLGQTQTTTDLCINALLDPYKCCTDSASAYECCFGLIGCIPPLPIINAKGLDNLDQITNAQCDGVGNVVLSIFFLPRVIFGTWLWSLIYLSPTWLRNLEFKVLYPLVYDYGGRGLTENFLGDFFCAIVNIYYIILIIFIFIAIYIIDAVFIQLIRDLIIKVDVAVTAVSAQDTREFARVQVRNLNGQIKGLSARIEQLEQKK